MTKISKKNCPCKFLQPAIKTLAATASQSAWCLWFLRAVVSFSITVADWTAEMLAYLWFGGWIKHLMICKLTVKKATQQLFLALTNTLVKKTWCRNPFSFSVCRLLKANRTIKSHLDQNVWKKDPDLGNKPLTQSKQTEKPWALIWN